MSISTEKDATHPTILIVGAGVFGVSTAYHLACSHVPPQNVILVDRSPYPAPPASDPTHHPEGASIDINKIVRADYTSPFYMDLAYQAIDAWSSWPIVKPFYHRSGWIHLNEKGSDLANRVRKNFRESERPDETKDMTFDEVRAAWGGILNDTDYEGFDSAYWNPGAGWAEADRAVAAMLTHVVEKGVKYFQAGVEQLYLSDTPRGVKGVRLMNGEIVEADKVILATGAWTSQILSKTEDELGIGEGGRIEQQIKAAGVCVAHYELSEREMEKFDQMPVIIDGERGDNLPPPPSRLFKFTTSDSFTNTVETPSKHQISVPPDRPQDVVPETLKSEMFRHVGRLFPFLASKDRPVSYWRLCWDSVSPSQDQLITKHPDERLGNLFLAVGGSFHSWKFLPTIGTYVANIVNGQSNGEEKDKHWAWKKERWDLRGEGSRRGAHEKVVPRRDLANL